MAKKSRADINRSGKDTAVAKLLRPIQDFIHMQVSGGLMLLSATVLAMISANSPWAASFNDIWNTQITLSIGAFIIDKPFILWINDGLMAIFFFLVGLEIKREIIQGEMSTVRKASLPLAAALGGLVLPALIYFAINPSGSAARGWAIPMATDIAFALGVMALMGKRVPLALKIFLTAVAIVDDIGAVMVIAIFYTAKISLTSLGLGFAGVAFLFLLNRIGVRNTMPYLIIGVLVWAAFLKSGVHATIAGILLAFTIPLKNGMSAALFSENSKKLLDIFETAGGQGQSEINEEQRYLIGEIEEQCLIAESPLQRLEHALHPWISFVIIPVFALANAGVSLQAGGFSLLMQPVALGVVAGLFVGKLLGITAFSWTAVKLGIAELPKDVNWRQIFGTAALAGIGFTMSLFIAMLGFGQSELLASAKLGILVGSLLSGGFGWWLLSGANQKNQGNWN